MFSFFIFRAILIYAVLEEGSERILQKEREKHEEAEIPDSEEMILAATSLFLDSSRYFIVILKKHILLGGKVVVSSS
jgi:hypothetical protein